LKIPLFAKASPIPSVAVLFLLIVFYIWIYFYGDNAKRNADAKVFIKMIDVQYFPLFLTSDSCNFNRKSYLK